MAIEKTVFISYRRKDKLLAMLIERSLRQEGFDAFLDQRTLASGAFAPQLEQEIAARAHFVVVLTPDALDRVDEPGDWLRREIEIALQARRNIVPLMVDGFSFTSDSVRPRLSGALARLAGYNGLATTVDQLDDGLRRLREQFLHRPLEDVSHPPETPPPAPSLTADAAATVPAAPAPMQLAVATLGLDDPAAPIVASALVVCPASPELADTVQAWKRRAGSDPLLPEPARAKVAGMPLAGLFEAAALRALLLPELAVAPFAGYLYYAPGDALAALAPIERRRRLLVQPLQTRLGKKGESITQILGRSADIEAAAEQAVQAAIGRFGPRVVVPQIDVRGGRAAAPLLEFADLLASACVRHLAAPQDEDAALLFEHLRTRIRFAMNVATGRTHTRDDHPLP